MKSHHPIGSAPLRVLMIAPTSFFADYGCHVRILEEIRALTALGHRVVICTYHNGDDVPGVAIRRSIDVPWRKRVIVGSSRHKIYLDAVLSLEALRTAVRFKPDIIHAHLHEGALIGGVLARLLRRPLVFDYQGSLTEEMVDHGFLRRGGHLRKVVRRLEHAIDELPNVIVTSTHNARERLAARGYGGPIHTVLDAVDTSRFTPDALGAAERRALRRDHGIPDQAQVVVYLGLLAPYQGTDLLLEAARLIVERRPETHFLLMGYPGIDRYRKKAEDLGIEHRVSFPGRIPYQDAPRHLALGDIGVAPKLSLTEGNGKIYNYMAAGLPVVAFDAPANREILGDLGVYADRGDVHGFARQVIDLLDHRDRAVRLGSLLRARAERRLAWDTRVRELLDVYATVLPAWKGAEANPSSQSITVTRSLAREASREASLEVAGRPDPADN